MQPQLEQAQVETEETMEQITKDTKVHTGLPLLFFLSVLYYTNVCNC